MDSVLVVGGAGYVGAHTCKALNSAGFRPITFDNLCTGHKSFVQWGPFIQGDIRSSSTVARAIQAYSVKAVLHFAASAYVGESVHNPQKYYENNVVGSLALLRGMLRARCSSIVFSSTCAVYGQPDTVPIVEGTDLAPVNPYGASKLMVERILSDYSTAYGLDSTILRYFNACGADPQGDIGELRDPETHLIPRAMMALQGYIDDFQIFGSNYPTPDGTAIRDYIHVSDLAEAHVAAVRGLIDGQAGGTFNLGTGKGHSVKEVVNAIEAETGRALPPVTGPQRAGDPAKLVADPSKARAALGFSPKRSDLATIIKTAWAWHCRVHPGKCVPVQ
jgi:UDP-glucose-4-epimerase GalE